MIRDGELTVRTIGDQGKDDYREAELHLEDQQESLFTVGIAREEMLLIAKIESRIE